MPSLPELLAPAGCWASLRAAVANGADAVYFGVDRFNARLRAENFRLEDLPEVMAWLHRRGVKGFLTVNVLVFTHELPAAA
ncbi:MAG: peptidase U32 family protein, partial [Vulcanococcus sp.]